VKRYLVAPMMLAAAAMLLTAPAQAELRVPQEPIPVGTLQSQLNALGESINVLTDQLNIQRWTKTISGNSAMTLQISLPAVGVGHELGLYSATDPGIPVPYKVLPSGTAQGGFAMASLRSGPDRITVTLFDADGNPQGPTVTQFGLNILDFGYYIKNLDGSIGYSQDSRQPGTNDARVLTYAGTGANSGCWWLCFEDNLAEQDGGDGRDFDDAVMFVESINPTPVSRTSWGNLKSRFR